MDSAIDSDSKSKLSSGRKGWADVASDIVAAARGAASDHRQIFFGGLRDFRPEDRLAAQRIEVGPVRLRKLQTHYNFLGFLALCGTVVLVVNIFVPGAPQQIFNIVNNFFVTGSSEPKQAPVPSAPPAAELPKAQASAATTTKTVVAQPIEILTKAAENAVKPPAPEPPKKPSDLPLDPVTKGTLGALGL